MTTPHARCESCGLSLPPNAFRCPTCGHHQGEAITVEVGRRSSAGPRSASPHRRRDLIVLAGVVAVVLAGLVFAGRDSGGREKAAANATTTTTSRPTTTSTSTSTTMATTTTSTTLPRLQLGAPSGVKLLTGGNNSVSVTDLDTGERTRPALPAGSGLVVVRGGVAVMRGTVAYFVPDPYTDTGTELGEADSIAASSSQDRVWLLKYSEIEMTVREVDLDGGVTAGPFGMPGTSGVIAAVHDGLITAAHGSIYVVDRSGRPRRIGTGDVLGAGGNSVLAFTCDDQLHCGTSVIDVASGDSREVAGFGDAERLGYNIYPSSDGTTMAIVVGTGTENPSLWFIDLESATARQAPLQIGFDSFEAAAFSRDSKWLFYKSGPNVVAYAPGTGEQHMLSLGSGPVGFLAVV
jgi:hypothetical protein